MKIKKFNNLWSMGLIIFGSLLSVFYLLKLIVPEFVVGVAEIPEVVAFGNYVDSNDWAYYLFTFVTSFVSGYFCYCAACRRKHLNAVHVSFLSLQIILCFLCQSFLPQYYTFVNVVLNFVCPALICFADKRKDIKYLYSIVIVTALNIFAQILSLEIRSIANIITEINSATYFILLIDVYIWQVLLYNYYNYKEVKNNGKTY